MSRRPREWYPGAFLHLMSRGNRKEAIFKNAQDYITFLCMLETTQTKYPFDLHAFCLMTNHFHLLVGTREEHVSKIMQFLLKRFTDFFNYKYDLVGHLFQGRYTSSIIKDDRYFMEVSRYIHMNPVKAGLVHYAEDYTYSSYPAYINGRNLRILKKDRVLSYFGGDNSQGIDAYRDFVEKSPAHEEHEEQIRKEMRENELWIPVATSMEK